MGKHEQYEEDESGCSILCGSSSRCGVSAVGARSRRGRKMGRAVGSDRCGRRFIVMPWRSIAVGLQMHSPLSWYSLSLSLCVSLSGQKILHVFKLQIAGLVMLARERKFSFIDISAFLTAGH
jgi:hypothetical protein